MVVSFSSTQDADGEVKARVVYQYKPQTFSRLDIVNLSGISLKMHSKLSV